MFLDFLVSFLFSFNFSLFSFFLYIWSFGREYLDLDIFGYIWKPKGFWPTLWDRVNLNAQLVGSCGGSHSCKLGLSLPAPCSGTSLPASSVGRQWPRIAQAPRWVWPQPSMCFAISSPVVLLGQRDGSGLPSPCKAQGCRRLEPALPASTRSPDPERDPAGLTLTDFCFPGHTGWGRFLSCPVWCLAPDRNPKIYTYGGVMDFLQLWWNLWIFTSEK